MGEEAMSYGLLAFRLLLALALFRVPYLFRLSQ